MRGALCRCVALVAALSLVVPSSSFAQTTQAATTEFNAEQLNALLAPIALYPDEQLAQVPIDPVTYYHVELPRHEVMLVEESYLDTGDRGNFANRGASVRLHPDFSIRMWKAHGCVPLIVIGPKYDAVRAWLSAIAAAGCVAAAWAEAARSRRAALTRTARACSAPRRWSCRAARSRARPPCRLGITEPIRRRNTCSSHAGRSTRGWATNRP